jgi:hypothetical protein
VRTLLAALLTVVQMAHAETLYESLLGPNGGAPYLRTRAQLEAMGGTWNGDRFTTRESFPNTNDPASVTFVAPVIYTPRKATPGR